MPRRRLRRDRVPAATRTATGSGIVLSLATIFPTPASTCRRSPARATCRPSRGRTQARIHAGRTRPHPSAAIIMLTDGQRTTGPDPLDAAKMASERGVRVYTVGIGTKEGETIGFEAYRLAFLGADAHGVDAHAALGGHLGGFQRVRAGGALAVGEHDDRRRV